MFRASSCPSSEATTIAAAASGLPLERGGSSVIGRGRLRIGILIARFRSIIILLFRSIIRSWSWSGRPARPRSTALLPPRSNGKPEAAAAIVVASDDGHEDVRNMLSCI